MVTNALHVSKVTAGYGTLTALWNVSFAVPKQHVCVILGPNGSGKSTLLKVVAGVLGIQAGSIELEDKDITSVGYSKRSRLGLGWVPEGRNIFENLTVEDNLHLSERRVSSEERRARRESLFELFPVLKAKLKHRAGTLSGGEQQILAIGRMLLREPKVVLLDEPSGGLAPVIVDRLAESLNFMKQRGAAVVVTEQNPAWLSGLVDSVRLMHGGQLAEVDGIDLVTSREMLRKAYLEG
jgi:branched-chain amino acid transport system ATP-binding protein